MTALDTLDQDQLDPAVLELCMELTCVGSGWDYAEAWAPMAESLVLAAVHDPAGRHVGVQQLLGSARLSAGEGVAGWVWQQRCSWWPDADEGSPAGGRPESQGDHLSGLDAVLAVPVRCDGNPVAVLVYYRAPLTDPGTRSGSWGLEVWRQQAVGFVEAMAGHAGCGLKQRRAQLRARRAETEARRRAGQHAALAALGRHILGGLALDVLVSVAVSHLTTLTWAAGAVYLRFAEDRRLLVVSAGEGMSRGMTQVEVPLVGSLAGRALAAGSAVTVERGTWADQVPGLVCGMAVPVVASTGTLGVVEAWATSPFSEDDLLFLANVASILGHAFDRRDFDLQVMAMEERQQRQISEAIHDDSLQTVVAARMRASLLAKRLPLGKERAMCERVADDLGVAIDRLRSLMAELHPGDLSRRGLMSSLATLLERIGRDFGVTTSVEGVLGIEPPSITTAAVYRICQEAVTNAVKHSAPGSVGVSVERRQGGILVVIQDDGAGFEPDATATEGHLGMESMHQRATRVGGWCRVVSTPGEGTTVTAWIPDRFHPL